MAQTQPTRGDQVQAQAGQDQPEAIKYGHVFTVTGELAAQPIAPRDAAAMRSAEDSVPGVPLPQARGGGFSAGVAMEKAAAYNQAVGAVHPGQASDAATNQGITVTQTAVPGGRIVTEFLASQVVGQYSVADQPMEATARAAGDRPVDRADAEAICAAETRASANSGAEREEDKIKIDDVSAARVVQADTYSDAGERTKAGVVRAAVTTAARLNQEDDDGA